MCLCDKAITIKIICQSKCAVGQNTRIYLDKVLQIINQICAANLFFLYIASVLNYRGTVNLFTDRCCNLLRNVTEEVSEN